MTGDSVMSQSSQQADDRHYEHDANENADGYDDVSAESLLHDSITLFVTICAGPPDMPGGSAFANKVKKRKKNRRLKRRFFFHNLRKI